MVVGSSDRCNSFFFFKQKTAYELCKPVTGVQTCALPISLAISWQPSPSTKLELTEKETLRFKLRFYYLGPLVTRRFYAALGNNKTSGTFEEWSGCTVTKDISLPLCSMKTLYTDKYIDLVLPDWSWFETWGHAGEDFAAYVKIMNGLTLTEGVNCTPYYYNVGRVIAKAGEFSEFSITKFEAVG